MFDGLTDWDYARWSWGTFAQDSWRMRPDLTLNLGVRYDLDNSYSALNPFLRTDKGLNTVRQDRNNVAPRAGVAWTPFDNQGRTLIRGGAGAYYDENHANIASLLFNLSILVRRSGTLNAATPLFNPFWPDQPRVRQLLAEALGRNTVPDVELPGITPDLAPDLQVPLTVQASGGIVHDFGGGFTASVDAVFARGVDQYAIGDRNIDLDATLQRPPGQVVRINPNYSVINQYGNEGRFNYRSLQVQAGFVPSTRHLAKLSYTFATSESNTHTALEGIGLGGGATNPFDFDEDYGAANSDIRHNLAVNGITALPLGIQVSGILAARSALPWSVVSTAQLDSDPFMDRPEPRNSRRGDPFFTLDARLSKIFRLGSRRTATAFVEVFNVTNATNLIGYVGTLGAALFGQPTAALERRRTQLGFRVDF
jgi:hypothetical protein